MDEYANLRFSCYILFTCISLGRGTSRTCFSPHIREIVSWRFISVPTPSLLLFYCISADLKSIAAAFYSVSSTPGTASLCFSLSVFSPRYKFSRPRKIQCRNKFHVWRKRIVQIFLLFLYVLNINGLKSKKSNPRFKTWLLDSRNTYGMSVRLY